jgi:glycosyltransferase involved in cell wall biosynthesis
MITERTAIVHDWFQGYHGSERVVETMRTELFADGNAPDVLTFHAARELLPAGLAASIVRESRLGRLPGISQRGHDPGRWRYLLPYMPSYFGRLDLEHYDLVISSSHACAVNVRPRPDAIHVCYCYTPMRYAWLPGTDDRQLHGIKGLALRALRRRLRRIDLEASRRPDAYIAISTAVRERIKRFYGRDAAVVHPPVDVDDLAPREKDREHFLWVHRLVGYKQPLAVAEAFRGLPYRLTMVGIGPLESELRARLPPNVTLLPWLPREELVRLYAGAGGFVHVGEEDFGISMVEALAAGTPVIGLRRGGAVDIVRPGIDGLLVDEPDVAGLRRAIAELSEGTWPPDLLAARAREFSRRRFAERFLSSLAELAPV